MRAHMSIYLRRMKSIDRCVGRSIKLMNVLYAKKTYKKCCKISKRIVNEKNYYKFVLKKLKEK